MEIWKRAAGMSHAFVPVGACDRLVCNAWRLRDRRAAVSGEYGYPVRGRLDGIVGKVGRAVG